MHHSTAAELAESAGRFADARAVPVPAGFYFFNGRGLFCFVVVLSRDGPRICSAIGVVASWRSMLLRGFRRGHVAMSLLVHPDGELNDGPHICNTNQ